MSGDSLKARTASGAVWGIVDSVSQQVLSLGIFIILGRLLTPELFGIVSTALIFVFLMRSTVLNAISSSLVTLRQPVDADYDTAFWLLVALSVAAVLVLNVTAAPLARLYRIPEFELVIRVTSLMALAFGLSYAHYGWARRNFRFRALALRNIAGIVAGGVAAIALGLAGHGLAALLTNQLLAAIVSLALLWMSIPWRPHWTFSRPRAAVLLSTAVPQGLTQSLQFAVQNFDTALVTYLLGPGSGGLYAAAKRIALAVQLSVWQPIAAVALPAFAEVAHDVTRVGGIAIRTAAVVMAICAPMFLAVGAMAPTLVLALFGRQWVAAAPVLAILSITGIAIPSMGVLHVLLMARRQTRIVLYFTLLQTTLSLAAVVLFGRRDIVAIAYCLALPAVVNYAATLLYVRHAVKLPTAPYLLAIARPLSAALLMALVIHLIPELGIGVLGQLAALFVVAGLTYALALFVVARETFGEVVAFGRRLLPKRPGTGLV